MERKNNIGLLHFLAAIGVMFGHQYVLLGGTAPAIFGMDVHSLSVRVIFVITGYLITESFYNSDSVGKYLFKRVKRIYPPLILSILLCVVVLGPLFSTVSFGEYLGLSKSYIFKNITLSPRFDLPGVFVDNIYPYAVNGSLWTLPVEIMCYLLVIPVMKLCDVLGKYGNVLLGFLTGVIWLVYVEQLTGQITGSCVVWGTDWFSAVQVAAYFWAGSFFARAKLKKYCNIQAAVVLCAVCSVMYGYALAIAYLPVITYVTLSFAFAERPVFSKFKGKLSYEIYLYSFPVQQSLIQWLVIRGGKMQSPMFMFTFSLVITLGVSYVANKLITSLMNGKVHENLTKYVSADKIKEALKDMGEQVEGALAQAEDEDEDDEAAEKALRKASSWEDIGIEEEAEAGETAEMEADVENEDEAELSGEDDEYPDEDPDGDLEILDLEEFEIEEIDFDEKID